MKRIKSIIDPLYKLVIIILIFSLLAGMAYSLLTFKYGDGILGLKKMYDEKRDSIDVLFLGSSHAFEDVNTAVLFDSYGIAAYVLAGSVQPYWNTYYYLLETLKTQTPKLIVLEAYASTFTYEYSDNSRIIKNTFGIREPIVKLQALKVSSPPDKIDDYFFGYRQWHSRYTGLEESDLREYYERPTLKYYKGYGCNFGLTPLERPNVDSVTDRTKLFDKTEEYYRKIIELAQNNDIPIMIMVSPYILDANQQKMYNESHSIADEYNVPFYNFCLSDLNDAIGLDYLTDFADAGHLNYLGNVKFTEALSDIMEENYSLPDRRSDKAYSSWENNSKALFAEVADQRLRMENDLANYLDLLGDGDYTVILATRSKSSDIFSNLGSALQKIGIDPENLKDGGIYAARNGTEMYRCSELSWEYRESFGRNILRIERQFDLETYSFDQTVYYNGIPILTNFNGCVFAVYDNFSRSVVEISSFTIDMNGNLTKSTITK